MHLLLHYGALQVQCSDSCSATQWKLVWSVIQHSVIMLQCYSAITGAIYCNIFQRSGRLCNAVCFNCSALWCIGQDLISSANSNEQSLFLLHGENLLGNIFADIWQQVHGCALTFIAAHFAQGRSFIHFQGLLQPSYICCVDCVKIEQNGGESIMVDFFVQQ